MYRKKRAAPANDIFAKVDADGDELKKDMMADPEIYFKHFTG